MEASQYGNRMNSLVTMSEKKRGSILDRFDWPEAIDDNQFWVPEELLTISGTEYESTLSLEMKYALSKWESMNFYSMNVHGERLLVSELASRLYDRSYHLEAKYLYHFIREENDHMAMFAEICSRYGELLPDARIDLGFRKKPAIEEFLIFARAILFEYYVDYYNKIAGKDGSIPSVIRDINWFHHEDEARHVAFGREILFRLHDAMRKDCTDEEYVQVENYIREYLVNQIELVYSTQVYEKVGIENPEVFRKKLLKDPARRETHIKWVKQPFNLFRKMGIFENTTIEAVLDEYFYQEIQTVDMKGRSAVDLLKSWLYKETSTDLSIDENLDLIDSRVIDSLKFMRFIAYIEQLSGKEIRLDEVDIDKIRTLSIINSEYFEAA